MSCALVGLRDRALNIEQLKDLLQIGKSATMLPSIAASKSGHWNQDESRNGGG